MNTRNNRNIKYLTSYKNYAPLNVQIPVKLGTRYLKFNTPKRHITMQHLITDENLDLMMILILINNLEIMSRQRLGMCNSYQVDLK